MVKLENGKSFLYQWDLNQRLVLDSTKDNTEIHFERADDKKDEALEVIPYEENGVIYADIPNIHLQNGGYITVYLYENGCVVEQFSIEVKRRKKPSGYLYTETEVLSYKALEERVKELEEKVATEVQVLTSQCKQYALLCNQILKDCQKLKEEMEV